MEKTLLVTTLTPVQRHHELVSNDMMCVGFAVLIYDHAITLGYEVDLIWRAPKNLVSIIFLMNRYLIPAVILGQFYEKFAPSHTREFCKVWIPLQGYLAIISYVSLHIVVALRVAAFYSNSIKIKRFLWIGGLFYVLYTTGFSTASSVFLLMKKISPSGACFAAVPSFMWAIWIPTVVVELALFILTVHSAASRFSSYENLGAFYHSLFRDGAVYFLVITCSSIGALMVWAKASPSLNELARPFSLCVVAVVGSRLILNLKVRVLEGRQNLSETKPPTGATSPDFEFRTYASWNVVAPSGAEVFP